MKPAARSRSWFDHATLARIGVALGAVLGVASLPGTARADVTPSREFVVIASECAQYWSIPGGVESPAGWNQLLSFAACVQDATVARIESADELENLVDELQSALDPALQLYIAAVEEGPGPIKVRATLQIARAEAALITRARASIAVPPDLRTNAVAAAHYRKLHEQLEPLLESPAIFACMLVAVIDRAVAGEPRLVPDAVTRNLLASARRVAAQLRKSWSIPVELATNALIAAPSAEQGEHTWLDFMSSTRTWMRQTRGYDR
jgi:hypothetical protein